MSRREPYTPAPERDGAKVFWKSIEQKNDPEEFRKRAASEFPYGVDMPKKQAPNGAGEGEGIHRRTFVTLGAITAALFAEGCARRPIEKILPYSHAPEYVIPGVPSHYATVREYRGDAIGLVVESHDGRPTKIEGNPDHPSSLGGTDAITQAALFDLYDPDRSRTPMRSVRGALAKAELKELDAALAELVRTHSGDQGAKLRILARPTNSPTFMRLRDSLLAKYPQAKVYTWAPVNESNAREGARIAFGQVVNVVPSYDQARVTLSLDSDFLGTEAGSVRATRLFAEGRRVRATTDDMSRLYVVEPQLTTTGVNADHRLRLPARDVGRYLMALATRLQETFKVDLGPVGQAVAGAKVEGVPEKWLTVVTKELGTNRGRSLIVCGSRQPAWVHALTHAINGALGGAGNTVNYFPAADPSEKDVLGDIKSLITDIEQSKVHTLFILGGNPVYDAPSELKFAEHLKNVALSVHLSSHIDETSILCSWHAPLAHELEAWGDQRALDGARSIQQPMIAPLFGGRSEIELLARITGDPTAKGHDLVQATMRSLFPETLTFDRVWKASLKKGVIVGLPSPASFGPMASRLSEVAGAVSAVKQPAKPIGQENLEVTFAADPKLYDGRHANNPWLLELPELVTKICWDNAATISQATADALGLASGDMVSLSHDGATPIEVAVWVLPGTADNTIGLTTGWGREHTGRYGTKHGFNVMPLRTSDALWMAEGVKLTKMSVADVDAVKDKFATIGSAGRPGPGQAAQVRPDDPFDASTHRYKFSQTQEHDLMEGRPVAIDSTLAEYRKQPNFAMYKDDARGRRSGSPDPRVLPIWDKVKYTGHKWGMSIDMNACTGCNACVIACQAENNIPSVGKEQIWRGREMYWIRIDRYFSGEVADPEVTLQPVACVQCEEAPCENVCPVNATEHSPEGLNDMAYNRCIGTRYCANNCPYKVRRFNFLNFDGEEYNDVPDTEQMKFNPNVTVRFRGVMEKCTYCVQRIQEGKIAAKREERDIKDGDIITACQQACPARAIHFGDLNDPRSKVTEVSRRDRGYHLLAELGTAPRTTHLAKLRNPNPEMV